MGTPVGTRQVQCQVDEQRPSEISDKHTLWCLFQSLSFMSLHRGLHVLVQVDVHILKRSCLKSVLCVILFQEQANRSLVIAVRTELSWASEGTSQAQKGCLS